MIEASSKLKMHIQNHIQNADIMGSGTEHLVLNGMLASFALLSICYVVFLGNMVLNIVERRTLEAEARTLSSEVSDLELTYLSMSNSIDVNLSHSLGFEEAKPNFATRKPLTALGLGYNNLNNEI